MISFDINEEFSIEFIYCKSNLDNVIMRIHPK